MDNSALIKLFDGATLPPSVPPLDSMNRPDLIAVAIAYFGVLPNTPKPELMAKLFKAGVEPEEMIEATYLLDAYIAPPVKGGQHRKSL